MGTPETIPAVCVIGPLVITGIIGLSAYLVNRDIRNTINNICITVIKMIIPRGK